MSRRSTTAAAAIKSVLGWQPDFDDLNTIVRTALAWEKIWQQKKAGH